MKKSTGKNKEKYRVNKAALWGITVLLSAAVFAGAYVLFTDTLVSLIAALILLLPVRIKVRRELERRYEKVMRKEFVSCLVSISGALSSGVRLEQAVMEIAASESTEFSRIRPEFIRMSKLIQLNLPAEKAFLELSERVPVPDIKLFSQALEYAVPSGINLIELTRMFSSSMRIRNDVEAEISRSLNLPRYNNRIVTAMPFFMIALMRLTAADYLSGLDSGTGNIVKMIVALLIIGAVILGELLGNINYAE